MQKIKSLDDLNRYRESILLQRTSKSVAGEIKVILSMGTPAVAAGALATKAAILDFIDEKGVKNVSVMQTGNIGFDSFEPIILVVSGEGPKIAYGKVTPEAAQRIMAEHVLGGSIVNDFQIEV
jgi:NADP-reducing hydrogenase subunit HndB